MKNIQLASKGYIKPYSIENIDLNAIPLLFKYIGKGTNEDETLTIKKIIDLEDFRYNAILGWENQDFNDSYMEGFYKAAKLLVKYGTHNYDKLIYPIIFNYRQYLELTLKYLNICTRLYFCEGIFKNNTHDLEGILKQFTEILDKYNIGNLVPDEIRESIILIHNMDKKNDRFRYAYDSKGELSHDYNHHFINLNSLEMGMECIYEFLSALQTWYYEDSDSSFTRKHFINFIYSLMELKKIEHLERNNLLGNKVYKFNKTKRIPSSNKLFPDNELWEYTHKYFVDKDSIKPVDQKKIECIVHLYVNKENLPYAKIMFNLNNKRKIESFQVLEI